MSKFILPSAAAFDAMIEEYIHSSDGADDLLRQGVYGEAYLKERLQEIGRAFLDEVNKSYGAAVAFGHKDLGYSGLYFSSVTPSYKPSTKQFTITVKFDSESLTRESLNPYNEGVYDIIGLLTQGYDIPDGTPTPRGYWDGGPQVGTRESGNPWFLRDGFTFAKRHRQGYPIIASAIEAFKARYPDVEVNGVPRYWR